MNTDPIADMLTRIRNAVKAKHSSIVMPYSKLKVSLLEVIKKNNFISDFKVIKNSKSFDEIEVKFNPDFKELNLTRVSKPGQRIYIKKNEIKPVLNGYGISILSTPKGLMTGDEAIKSKTGGEYICKIW